MTSSSPATSTVSAVNGPSNNLDSLLDQVKRNLGLPVGSARLASSGDGSAGTSAGGAIIDAAPFVAPFAKGERIYRIADWISPMDGRPMGSGSASYRGSARMTAGSAAAPEEEDWTLSHAEPSKGPTSRRLTAPRTARGILPPRGASTAARPPRFAASRGMHATGAKKLGWGQRGFDRQKMREPSVKIESTWPVLDEIEFSRISRLQFDPEAPELLATAGTLRFYNRALDRLSTKTPRAVSIEDVALAPYARISDDPIVRRLAADGTAQVFMSDVVATLLMAAPRTVMPWDLVARRLDGTDALIIDQRDDAHLDYTPVGETSYEPPSDDKDQFNSAANLSTEATRISAILPTIICAPEETVSLEQEDMPARPPTGPRAGHTAYKYYKWTMGDGLHFVIRSEINGMARVASQQKTLLIRSLLEFDSSRSGSNVDWRTKLDNQRGAVLANEIKNNNAIIARWVFQALLAQADLIKLAYVARVSPKDRVRHDLLALHDLEPAELAVQINLDEANGFGILKTLVDRILSASVATVAIVRDPSKPMLRLYDTSASV